MKIRQASFVVVDLRAGYFVMSCEPIASCARAYNGMTEDPHGHCRSAFGAIVRPRYVIQTGIVSFNSDYNIELSAEHRQRA